MKGTTIMEKTANPIDVANYVIDYLKERGESINHLKLQKLLYYIEAWHLVFFDTQIFTDEIEAWEHGPIIRRVWDYFKKYSILYNELPASTGNYVLSDEQKDLINDVLDEYGDKTGYYLENLTHSEEPWRQAWASPSKILQKDFMKKYYGERINVKETETIKEPVTA